MMSYSVSVTLPLKEVEKREREIVDELAIEANTYFYLSEALAGNSDMYEYWINPARQLQLSLLSMVGEKSLRLVDSSSINVLLNEVACLEDYWRDIISSDELHYGERRIDWLLDRAQNLRKASKLAIEKQAVLSIE